MNLDELYNVDKKDLQRIWELFLLFNPKMNYFRQNFVSEALETNDRQFFIDQVRGSFFPGKDDASVQREYFIAVNKGIDAINSLLETHLPEHSEFFKIKNVSLDTVIFDFVKSAHNIWKEGRFRDGKHKRDYNLLLSAYDKVRAIGIGRNIKNIEQAPEILSTLKRYQSILKWFDELLGFREAGVLGENKIWETKSGAKLYGRKKPLRSRVKILDSDTDEIKYSSILMKMYLRRIYANEISDHAGVEFLVGDESDRSSLIKYFQKRAGFTGLLENFKRYEKSGNRENQGSSSDFGCVKFTLRPPCPVDSFTGFNLGNRIYEKIPVEVQILTLSDDQKRRESPHAEHSAYKKRQFMQIFPALFPKRIYAPLMNQNL
ncbi:hypothetical protein KY308_02210 [Candidatus Woesearchaeota archaeon]|nr:hypothetical protein [Candidatus Woesearchaeota archaeon]